MTRKSRRRLSVAGGLITSLASGWIGTQPAYGADASKLALCIGGETQRLNFSGSVLVAIHGVTTTYARGVTQGQGSPDIAADTRFNLGSSGKMFTATAVAQLIEARKVHLEDPIGQYVHGLAPEASAVTIRELLSHSSGLGDFLKPEAGTAIRTARHLRDLVPLVQTEKPAFKPGSTFLYSNTGYLLLGMMVERVSGQTYAEYLRDHIAAPAHMTATTVDPGPIQDRAIGMTAMSEAGQKSSGRSTNAPKWKAFESLEAPDHTLRPARASDQPGTSAGASYSTAYDMQKFFSAFAAGKLVGPTYVKMLTSSYFQMVPPNEGQPGIDYGFGFGTSSFEGHRWFGHAGGLPGANAETNFFPDDDVVMIVLSNRDPPAATIMYNTLRAAVFSSATLESCAAQAGRSE